MGAEALSCARGLHTALYWWEDPDKGRGRRTRNNMNFHTKSDESKITEKGPKQGQHKSLYFFGEAQTGRAVASSGGGVAQAAFTFEEEEYICSYSKLQCWPSVQILFLGSKTTVVPTLKKQG